MRLTKEEGLNISGKFWIHGDVACNEAIAQAQRKKYSKFLLEGENLLTTQGRKVIIRLAKERED